MIFIVIVTVAVLVTVIALIIVILDGNCNYESLRKLGLSLVSI